MTKFDELIDLLEKAPDEVFIQPHNVTDPDAMAASFGLQYLLKTRGRKTVYTGGQRFLGGHDSMADGFLSAAGLESSKSLHTFVRHRAITFVESR